MAWDVLDDSSISADTVVHHDMPRACGLRDHATGLARLPDPHEQASRLAQRRCTMPEFGATCRRPFSETRVPGVYDIWRGPHDWQHQFLHDDEQQWFRYVKRLGHVWIQHHQQYVDDNDHGQQAMYRQLRCWRRRWRRQRHRKRGQALTTANAVRSGATRVERPYRASCDPESQTQPGTARRAGSA